VARRGGWRGLLAGPRRCPRSQRSGELAAGRDTRRNPGAGDETPLPRPPAIFREPRDAAVWQGGDATFAVAADGYPPPSYEWQRNGAAIADAIDSSYTTLPLDRADNGARFRCVVTNSAGSAESAEVVLTVTEVVASFTRGDGNADGVVNVEDAVHILRLLFGDSDPTPCRDAADVNDDGRVNIADPITLLSCLLGRGQNPPAPFPECGADPTVDQLSCSGYPSCGT